MLKIGQTIKTLRKKQDITQEKLAAYLNISYQAISKWENGSALPDVTLIPQIANFFGVTADELLGMKEDEQTEELKLYEKRYFEYGRQGKVRESIELAREVSKKHPRNFQWMLNLAYELIAYHATQEQVQYTKEHKFKEEAVEICERILEDCTTDSIRHSAIQILCYTYPELGQTEKAVTLANTMPDLFSCQNHLLTQIYEGEEKLEACQQYFILLAQQLSGLIWILVSVMGKELTPHQQIALSQKAISLIDLLFEEDKDNGFWAGIKKRMYERMAKLYAGEKDAPRVIQNLLLAEQYATIADASLTQSPQKYNSLPVNRLTFDPKNVAKNFEGTERQWLLTTITNDKAIGQFKDLPEIKELVERLERA